MVLYSAVKKGSVAVVVLIFIVLILAAGAIYVFKTQAGNEPVGTPIVEPVVNVPAETPVVTEAKSSISFYPETTLPGDPAFITIHSTSTPVEITYDGKRMNIFTYKGMSHAVRGIDFNEKILEHTVKATLSNGEVITKVLTITPREKIERPIGIPEKLGGNTPEASKNLVNNLATENAELGAVSTSPTQLWTDNFGMPLEKVFVTDDYGYNRATVGQTIVHKGTDFRAATGTPVFAMNAGKVVLAKTFTVYGNTVVVDHGLGVHTLYMHLSKLNVKVGDTVKVGDMVGLSGMTGYAEAPHLHVSVRVGGISIDPMRWVGWFEGR